MQDKIYRPQSQTETIKEINFFSQVEDILLTEKILVPNIISIFY